MPGELSMDVPGSHGAGSAFGVGVDLSHGRADAEVKVTVARHDGDGSFSDRILSEKTVRLVFDGSGLATLNDVEIDEPGRAILVASAVDLGEPTYYFKPVAAVVMITP